MRQLGPSRLVARQGAEFIEVHPLCAGAHVTVTQLKNPQFEQLLARGGILTVLDDAGHGVAFPPYMSRESAAGGADRAQANHAGEGREGWRRQEGRKGGKKKMRVGAFARHGPDRYDRV
jgi:hypothetical protein